jgi:NAD(P)-dependent dehydrogenase (short-subunit alcohol dehydrogenase family)
MKVAITGHTKGLGAELAARFTERGDEVMGFARSNGYDLYRQSQREAATSKIIDSDIFINNTHFGFGQMELLGKVFAAWQDDRMSYRPDVPLKIIVNISSESSYHQKDSMRPYSIQKIALDEQARQLQRVENGPKIINVRPGYFDTKVKGGMKIETVADVVMYAINNVHLFLIKDIVFVPPTMR